MDSDDDRDRRDEQLLVERARSDADAFAELYRRHVDAIHRFIYRRCGDRELAEDLTAATFERALERLDRFRWHPSGIAPWLFRIAGNLLTDHHRRQGRRRGDRARRAADRLHDHVAVDDVDRIDDADQLAELRAALDRLNPRYERALTLRHLSGLSHEEAARAMGVAPSLMAVLVHRATAALRRELGGGGER
ncbi:MAG: sigma-70 family RNA polymerase sigma factor [Acidimicrobiales bacterium]|nr:sigma-70 family RNA polymerase sigma factor [Acidimicrobiales bacterium]